MGDGEMVRGWESQGRRRKAEGDAEMKWKEMGKGEEGQGMER